MKRIIALLLVVVPCAMAAPEIARREVCQIAEVERVDGKLIPQRGIRIFQLSGGDLIGEYVQYGGRPFGGSTEFDKHIKAALRQVPADVSDWNRYLGDCQAKVQKMTGRNLAVLDGWTTRILVDFEGTKVDLVGANVGVFIRDLAPYYKRLAALAHLLDAVAIEVGRGEMAL